MNSNLLIIGTILLVFGYLIGVKQKIELITFLRNKHVLNRQKVATIVGGSQFVFGAILITLGAIGFENDPLAVVFVVIILLLISVFVMRNYVA